MEQQDSSPELFFGFDPEEISQKKVPLLLDTPTLRISQPRTSKSKASLVWRKGSSLKRDSSEKKKQVINRKPVNLKLKSGGGKEELPSCNGTISPTKLKPKPSFEKALKRDSTGKKNQVMNLKPVHIKSGGFKEPSYDETIPPTKLKLLEEPQTGQDSDSSCDTSDEDDVQSDDSYVPPPSVNYFNKLRITNAVKNNRKKKKASTNCFTCNQCGRQYKYLRGLRQHLKLECNKEPQFPCPYCPTRYRYRQNIRDHVRTYHELAFPKWYATHYVIPMFTRDWSITNGSKKHSHKTSTVSAST